PLRSVRVLHLHLVAGLDLPSCFLADQCSLRVLVIVPGPLCLTVKKYHRAIVEVSTGHKQLPALDGEACDPGRRPRGHPQVCPSKATRPRTLEEESHAIGRQIWGSFVARSVNNRAKVDGW